jgi:hypothetical protein
LTAKELASLETTDPLLEAENSLAEDPMLRSLHDTTTPMKVVGKMFRLSEDTNTTETPEELEALLKQSASQQEEQYPVSWRGFKKLFHGFTM